MLSKALYGAAGATSGLALYNMLKTQNSGSFLNNRRQGGPLVSNNSREREIPPENRV